ncbi:MAG TPA: helix-turn-helix transcriptional regulator [Gemmatimonadaceae bacterium]
MTSAHHESSSSSRLPSPESLTPREREVLARIAAGMTSKEIAAALGVGLRTVNTHREHIAKKLSTSSVAALVRYAIEHGITEID